MPMLTLVCRMHGRDITIRSHSHMHADELFALWLFVKFATTEFLDRFCLDNQIDLGVNGGIFDGHAAIPPRVIDKDACCSVLMADALGIRGEPSIRPIIRFLQAKNKGVGALFDLAQLVDLKHLLAKSVEDVIRWVFMVFDSFQIKPSEEPPSRTAEARQVIQGEDISLIFPDGVNFNSIFSIFLLQRFGTPIFVQSHAVNGIIMVRSSSMSKMASYLHVEDKPELKLLLKSACRGPSTAFDIFSLIARMYRATPDQTGKVVQWGLDGIEAIYRDQCQFFHQAKKDFEQGLIEEVTGPGGQTIRVATVNSDYINLSRYARSHFGGYIDVCIQMRSMGNTLIITRKKSGIRLRTVAFLLSQKEQELTGGIFSDQWEDLTIEGLLPDQRWYFQHEPAALFNGTLCFDVPPTKIPLSEITRLVKEGLKPLP